MMQLPGVSVKRSVLIGLRRSLSFLTDIAIIIYLADILALLCGAHTSGGSPAAHVYGCFHSVLPAAAAPAAYFSQKPEKQREAEPDPCYA